MGHELHIHRWTDHLERDGPGISEDEWTRLYTADASLTVDGKYRSRSMTVPVIVWPAPEAPDSSSFRFDRGAIRVTNPTRGAILKACEIAAMLNARVEDDEFGVYSEDGSCVRDGQRYSAAGDYIGYEGETAPEESEGERAKGTRRSWLSRLLGR